MNIQTFNWRCSLAGATVRSVDPGIRIQISGKQYQSDRIETGKGESTCHFSEVGLSLRVAVEKAEGLIALSGVLRNQTSKAVRIDQLWFGESLADLGGPARKYRVYYNSGCQESSGTCRFSATKGATGIAKAYTDPDDPDSHRLGTESFLKGYSSHCIQPDYVRSQYVTAVYSKEKGVAVCLGNTCLHRAETVIFVKPSSSDTAVIFSPVILYDGLQLDPGEDLAVEEISVFIDKSPLTALERYVERAREKKKLTLKPIDGIAGFWNTWVAFTETENNAGAELGAMEYQQEKLLAYNIRSCPVGVVWHRDNAFFESRCKPHLGASIADAIVHVARRFPDFHICGGLFWGAASECSDFFIQHSEGILRDKEGPLCRRGEEPSWTRCPAPGYWIDFSHPATKEFFRSHLRSLKDVKIRTFNLDFMGDRGEWKGAWGYLREDDNPFLSCTPSDAHMNRPFETDRVVPQTIRETLGQSVVIRSYTASFIRYLGIVDVVRIAPDTGRVEYGGKEEPTDWDHLRAILANLAANYMFHGKWWWSDADSICVGTRVVPARLEEFRIRSLLAFIVGGPITLGDKIPQMAPGQFRYCTVNMPPTGNAARPLDLFEKVVPETYHFPKGRTGFDHDLLTLINLSNAPRNYDIPLADLGIHGECLAFEFWTKDLVATGGGLLKVTVPALAARHYSLHRNELVPQVVGTDFHLSMGAVEIGQTQWDEKSQVLRGAIRRPAKETGHIYVSVPTRFDLNRTRVVGARIGSLGKVLVLDVEASSEPVAWQLSF